MLLTQTGKQLSYNSSFSGSCEVAEIFLVITPGVSCIIGAKKHPPEVVFMKNCRVLAAPGSFVFVKFLAASQENILYGKGKNFYSILYSLYNC